MTKGGTRCYFDVQKGSEYCPGHQREPSGGCDMEALRAYQVKHGVDYPCGREDDVERVFNPDDYRLGGNRETRPLQPEDMASLLPKPKGKKPKKPRLS